MYVHSAGMKRFSVSLFSNFIILFEENIMEARTIWGWVLGSRMEFLPDIILRIITVVFQSTGVKYTWNNYLTQALELLVALQPTGWK